MNNRLSQITSPLKGSIKLAGSKSISNRLLIIQALASNSFDIKELATAEDTVLLQKVLCEKGEEYDVHHAGTSYRFLCSYLCLQEGEQVLTGSSRMKERPIGPLVDALRKIGASIEYLENEGYPPLKIGKADWNYSEIPLKIDATISSQFISSLLLIAPRLPQGLKIELVGDLVSRPYLEMTLSLMEEFHVRHTWEDNIITIEHQEYKGHDYTVEADWSAASYYYGLVAMVPGSVIELEGLRQKSVQGDAGVEHVMKQLGVYTTWKDSVCTLTYMDEKVNNIEQDFLLIPDLAQTIAVTCAGLGITALYSGLQTLKVKETDRITALQNELVKVQVYLSKLPSKFSKNPDAEYYMQDGKATVGENEIPVFASYRDHRMAMSFAMLSAVMDVEIEDSAVVGKSYPGFWEDMECIGLEIEEIQ